MANLQTKSSMFRELKPRNARAARVLKHREPQVIENAKTTLFLKSTSSSSLANSVATDLYSLKRPLAARFTKKNALHPFEDATSFEFFSQKNDTSLLCFSSHSKKRPHNLTFVRTFNGKMLDMLECLIDAETARLMGQFSGSKARVGMKPLLSFSGPFFEDTGDSTTKFHTARSIFLDFFRGEETAQVDVEGLQTMITFAGSETSLPDGSSRQTVHMRVWNVITKRSGQKLPRIELEETGPRLDFRLGRLQVADESVYREALKRSTRNEARAKKNIDTDQMGHKVGRIHMLRQDFDNLQTRKMKGLKRGRNDEIEGDLADDLPSGGTDDSDGGNDDDAFFLAGGDEDSELDSSAMDFNNGLGANGSLSTKRQKVS